MMPRSYAMLRCFDAAPERVTLDAVTSHHSHAATL